MVLDDLLDLALQLRRDLAGRDLLKERALRRREVLAELALPLGDLVDGDGVELKVGKERSLVKKYDAYTHTATHQTVDTSVDDGDLDLRW